MLREKEFEIKLKHPRSELGELDYVYTHNLLQHYFWKVSSYICIECKNWEKKIKRNEIVGFKELIDEKKPLSCFGVFLTTSSFSPSAIEAIKRARKEGVIIVRVERKHLTELIELGFKCFIQKLCEDKFFKKT